MKKLHLPFGHGLGDTDVEHYITPPLCSSLHCHLVGSAPHRMGLLLPLVLCALAVGSGATSPPQQVFNPSPLLSRGCNDSDVLSFANFALGDINRDRKDGYVLSLNRVSDVREHRQDGPAALYYLTLDVVDTDCHVLSRKSWKDCNVRPLLESVYGQCKALFYMHKTARILYTLSYNCTLRPVSSGSIRRMCPDCPVPGGSVSRDFSDPKVLEAATESLAKYNSESTSKQYSLVKVTKASSQWVDGHLYSVEYLIKEAPCTKSQASSCTHQSPDSEAVGLCKGSLIENGNVKSVSVTCDFFKSQTSAPGGENSAVNLGPAQLPKVEDSQQKKSAPTDAPATAVPKGSVQYLPDLGDEKPQGSQESVPVEAFPVHLDLTRNPQGEPVDISFLFMGPEKETVLVLPFPSKEQRSAECPGPAQEDNPFLLPPQEPHKILYSHVVAKGEGIVWERVKGSIQM
ncbi:fetuin-B-like isoform X2 [Talpa occidentalis]|uniref:fetuin-B-like isoform X2 n=1 Tax=Talpa occidentalis TaxID=50954 RepID=UPI0023F6FCFA|nr:fetuin-B-like isoform X2 [Talpa occidentalis]